MAFRESARNWVNDRIPLNWTKIKEESVGEQLPTHMKYWWFCLGGVPLLLFGVLIGTGILLVFHYVPHPDKAYESVQRISTEVPYGWWVRGLHKWAAEFMVVAVILHTIRVFFTGAYRAPRELVWIVGSILLFLTFGAAFTGYSLVYSQMSYWASQIGTSIADSTPIIGHAVANFMRGGPEVGEHTLGRFFVFHTAVMPIAIVVLIVTHLFLIRAHGIAEHISGMLSEMVKGISKNDG